MNAIAKEHSCPGPLDPRAGTTPFSPLGWSVWHRLGVTSGACAVLWAVVLWVLD